MEIQRLVDELGAEGAEQRKSAREALAAVGVEAMRPLLAALVAEPPPADRGDLAWLLRRVGEPALMAIFENPHPMLRVGANLLS